MPKKPDIIPVSDYIWCKDLLIPPDLQVGLKWKGDDGEDYESILPDTEVLNGKRKAYLKLSSFEGLTPGAIHFYAEIKVWALHVLEVKTKEIFFMGGYGPDAPKLENIVIEAQRPILAGEKDGVGEPLGKPGELTYRFNSEEEAKRAGIELFRRKFKPGWILINEELNEAGVNVILGET